MIASLSHMHWAEKKRFQQTSPAVIQDRRTYKPGGGGGSCTFHSCEHLVQLCNNEFELMKHIGDETLSQSMVDTVCVCVWGGIISNRTRKAVSGPG